ncbi:MAG: hypothetical protein ACFFCS_02555 [Candidatus Hodarchaeota archaeon]
MNQAILDMVITPLDSIICALCIIPVIFALLITVYQIYKGIKYRYFIFSSLLWLATVIFQVFYLLSGVLGSTILILIGFYFLIPAEICLLIKGDLISRDSIGLVKLSIYAMIAPIAMLFLAYQEGMVILTEGINEVHSKITVFGAMGYLIILLPSSFNYLFIVAKVNYHAPKSLRKYSIMFLTGIVINSILSPLFQTFIPFVWSSQIFIGIGSILVAFTVAKQPKILFVLPFKVFRLTVLDTESGVSMFTHDWSQKDNLANEHLYAGMLQGVSLIIKESLHRGEVRDIHMDKAVLMIERNVETPIACVLVATKASRVIRDGLSLFAKRFYKEYSQYLDKRPHDMSKFDSATKLIEECFPFIPKYD